MANLLITRHPANYHGLRRHLIASPFRAGKHFLMFVLIVMAGVMSLLYLMHFTDVHTKGYLLKKLELERDELVEAQEIKQMNLAKVKSLDHIQSSGAIQGMVPARNIIFLKSESEVAQK